MNNVQTIQLVNFEDEWLDNGNYYELQYSLHDIPTDELLVGELPDITKEIDTNKETVTANIVRINTFILLASYIYNNRSQPWNRTLFYHEKKDKFYYHRNKDWQLFESDSLLFKKIFCKIREYVYCHRDSLKNELDKFADYMTKDFGLLNLDPASQTDYIKLLKIYFSKNMDYNVLRAVIKK
jgi:hypothetical protein